MKRGFTLAEFMAAVGICIILVLLLAVPFIRESRSAGKLEEMRASGCQVIGYAGRGADIRVYKCKGYDDVVTERDWQGSRVVEKQ